LELPSQNKQARRLLKRPLVEHGGRALAGGSADTGNGPTGQRQGAAPGLGRAAERPPSSALSHSGPKCNRACQCAWAQPERHLASVRGASAARFLRSHFRLCGCPCGPSCRYHGRLKLRQHLVGTRLCLRICGRRCMHGTVEPWGSVSTQSLFERSHRKSPCCILHFGRFCTNLPLFA
jgi:hypothetical protein